MRTVIFAFALLLLGAACALPVPARPTPTAIPEPPEVRPLTRGVQISGHGDGTTDGITPQYDSGLNVGIDVVKLTHDGHSSFIVTATQDSQSETVASAIGPYTGERPLVITDTIAFHVVADGNWTMTIQPIPSGATPNFSGNGDAVGGYFNPPAPSTWTVSHDGKDTFYVYAHCVGGSILVENTSGAVHDSPQVEFPRGPCFWEVRADGAWSLQPSP